MATFCGKKLGNESLGIFLFYSYLLLSALYVRLKRSKRCRRYAVRPINRLRKEKGLFDNLIQSMLQQDHEYFFKYTRMTPMQFHNLLQLVQARLQKNKTKNPLPPAHRLIITSQ
ncbi:hypothetical protein RN001_012729 [Aquatica leii]|uniref:Uncharacterized protein n=1 Tax=Aquatica leii TaxID=1421715 RepID=A0AAN7PUR0_9COLE|nr:hypothetical protein RN001_012729 [Aquatica leii]